MCGISGTVLSEQGDSGEFSVVCDKVREMARLQHERGPDHTGFWSNESTAAFGHNRLAILDPSPAGNQPMESEHWVLVYNGEIYNHLEIRGSLGELNNRFDGTSDTETLLASIENFGIESTLDRLNGIFAFAAYHKASGTLHLVRDRLGIKPLFYYQDEESGTVTFASTPAAIASTQRATWSLNRHALHRYFFLGAIFSDDTLFTGIHRLPAATHLTFSGRNIDRERYWKPSPREGDLAEAVRTAIESQKLSDVPVSLFLSGGVDSSVSACVLKDEVDAVHLSSPEEKYARHVAESLGIDLEIVNPSEPDFDKLSGHYVQTSGEPSMASLIPSFVCETIHAQNYKVGISGNGADELFYGYPRTPSPTIDHVLFLNFPYEAAPSASIVDQLYHIFRHPSHFSTLGGVAVTEPHEWIDEMEERFALSDFPFPSSASYRWLELQTYVVHDLNPTLDFASMAYGVEMRVPFLDHVLVETALSQPESAFITKEFGRKSPLKSFLRDAGIFPATWSRPKIGFSIPPELEFQLRRQCVEAVGNLVRDGFLRLHGDQSKGVPLRDIAYLLKAALSFEHWKKTWVDSGKVAV